MSAETSPGSHEEHHVLPLKVYYLVFAALLVLTALTVGVSYADMGPMAIYVALAVAVVKAGFVVGYFMHLKFDNRFLTLVFVGGLIFLVVMFGLTFVDLITRGDFVNEHANFSVARDEARRAKAKALEQAAGLRQPSVEAAASGAKPPDKMRTVEVTPQKINQGKQLFAQCAACHGVQGEGRVGMGPAINSRSFLAAASDELLLTTIRQGRAGTTMVAWGRTLKPGEIEALVAYIRSLAKVEPVELDESPLKGDADAGGKLYGEICAACHGRRGAGYQETANGTGIGRKAFLASVTNGYMRYIIKHGKTSTKMKAFDQQAGARGMSVANLTAQQIEDVISYLRDKAW